MQDLNKGTKILSNNAENISFLNMLMIKHKAVLTRPLTPGPRRSTVHSFWQHSWHNHPKRLSKAHLLKALFYPRLPLLYLVLTLHTLDSTRAFHYLFTFKCGSIRNRDGRHTSTV